MSQDEWKEIYKVDYEKKNHHHLIAFGVQTCAVQTTVNMKHSSVSTEVRLALYHVYEADPCSLFLLRNSSNVKQCEVLMFTRGSRS